MPIRKSTLDDLPAISDILYGCRLFMKSHGNPNQWEDMDRVIRKTKEDIALGNSYVYVDNDVIEAVFTLALGVDPTYIHIEDGKWLNDRPYVTIHRIGSTFRKKGILKMAVDLALTMANDVRADTSIDNAPMRKGMEKLGFQYCGIIYIDTGESRLAYQLSK
ncbi:MAG: GNAT family N-acetyltransferase [Bacilli bacterium]|nr:GNAT family N-acetyltransferase [Bacilli bacterium]